MKGDSKGGRGASAGGREADPALKVQTEIRPRTRLKGSSYNTTATQACVRHVIWLLRAATHGLRHVL